MAAHRSPELAAAEHVPHREQAHHTEQRRHPADDVDVVLDPLLDLRIDELHGEHVDEEGLKRDVENAQLGQQHVVAVVTLVHDNVGHGLQRLHQHEVGRRQIDLFGLALAFEQVRAGKTTHSDCGAGLATPTHRVTSQANLSLGTFGSLPATSCCSLTIRVRENHLALISSQASRTAFGKLPDAGFR